MRNDPEVQRAVSSYQLGLPRMPSSGRSGELLGQGTGSSIEFQEFREYLPGDDIRHLDWAAYARSDALMVRLYREEISPRTEILVDVSQSMTTGEGTKQHITQQLAATFALLSGQLGGKPNLMLLDDARIVPLSLENLEQLEHHPFSAKRTLPEILSSGEVPLKRQAVRIVISDFLFPHDPDQLLRQLAGDASALWVLQVLTAWESNPEPTGGRRLIDAESRAEIDLRLDRNSIADYKHRLSLLQQELARAARRLHATFVTVTADDGLERICRESLTAAGILRAE